MNMKLFTGMFMFLLTFSAMSTGVILQSSAQTATNPDAVTSLSLLSPNTNPARNAWATLMENELPKIGIDVVEHNNAGWDVVGPRTFSYPATQESGIPLYEDGGYDIFFVGLSGAIDYNPTGSYHSASLSPSGNNFAFYENDAVDTLISAYTSELDASARAPIAGDIQAIIQDELPYIGLTNTASLWAYGDDWDVTPEEFLFLSTTSLADGYKDLPLPGTSETLVYAQSYALTEFTPFVIQSYIAAQYLNPIFATLYERDPLDANFGFSPLIASAMPTVSADNLVMTIPVRSDVTFSNGAALDADDVVNSLRMHWSNISIANSATMKIYIDEATDIVNVGGDVQVTFNQPYFLALNLVGAIPIHPDELIGAWDSPASTDFNAEPLTYGIGAGPYKFDSIDSVGGNVRLVKVAGYWNGEAIIDAIEYKFYGTKDSAIADLEGGAVDVIDAQFVVDVAEVEGKTGIAHTIVSDFGTQMMVVNMRHPVFGTGEDTPLGVADPTKAADAAKYVRQAISYAVPRDTIVDTILAGVGTKAQTIWPDQAAGYTGNTLEQYDYDLEKAKYYLRAAGFDVPSTYVAGTGDPADAVVSTTDDDSDDDGLPINNLVPVAFVTLFVTSVILRRRR